jgi:hypothetical protein
LVTVKPGQQGARNDTSGHVPKSEAESKKAKRLRAILRAPEIVQSLYRDGLLNQTTAAKMGHRTI